MRDYMFRNRWGALLFVGLTVAGALTLVGTDKDAGALQQATERLAQNQQQAEQFVKDQQRVQETVATQGEPSQPAVMAATDEELIDPATGIDPTPVDEFAAAQEQASSGAEVQVVARDSSIPSDSALPQPAPATDN